MDTASNPFCAKRSSETSKMRCLVVLSVEFVSVSFLTAIYINPSYATDRSVVSAEPLYMLKVYKATDR
jgi:hypothetical protein